MSFGTQPAVQGGYGMNLNPSLTRVEIPEVLDHINGILSSICSQRFINPYTAVQKIKNLLGQIGIVFEHPMFFGDEGGVTVIAKQFPKFGPNNSGKYDTTDIGSDTIPGGLAIRFNWVKIKGIYTIEVELQRKHDSSLPTITEPITEKWTFAGMLRKERARVRNYRIGKSFKRKYTKHKYGVSTSKGFSHKKHKNVGVKKISRVHKIPKAKFN